MFKKIMIIIGVLIAALLVAAVIYLNSVFIPRQLKPLVISKLEQVLNKKVTIEKAFYFPFKGVLFTKVAILNNDNTPFLNVKSVELRLKSLPKLKGKEIVLKAKLLIKRFSYEQEKIKVRGGSVADIDLRYVNGNLGFVTTVLLNNVELLGLPAVADVTGMNGKITCTDKSFNSAGIKARAGGKDILLKFSGKYDKKQAELENLDLTYGKSDVSISGKVDDFVRLQANAHAQGVLKLEDLKSLLGKLTLPDLSGDCQIDADLGGVFSDLAGIKGKVTLQIAKGSVNKIKFSDVKAEANLEKGTLQVTPLYIGLYGGKIEGMLKAVIADTTIPCEGHISVDKVNIQQLVIDLSGMDLGEGMFSAYLEGQLEATDITSALGSGWVKLLNGAIRPPPKFEKIANSLKVAGLSDMKIQQAQATFKIHDQKIETLDFEAVAKEATITGSGYLGFDLKTEFECVFKLSREFVQSRGGLGNLPNFISDNSGLPLAKIKVWGVLKPNGLRYKPIPFAVNELFKNGVKQSITEGIKNILKNQGQDSGSGSNIKQQIEKGLEGLFKR